MSDTLTATPRLSNSDLHELSRWNTPTIYNGWEQITAADSAHDAFNPEPTHDFMPQLPPMVGYAVTVVIQSGNPEHRTADPDAVMKYLRYVAECPAPTIVVVQDLDSPRAAGSFWGEVNSNIHRALGCVGTITDGAVRDVDEMTGVGFKTLARHLCVGHAHAYPIRWGCEVEVFGRRIQPGQLIHADKHGFLAVPPEDEADLLDAARFMDAQECRHLIPIVRHASGLSREQIIDQLDSGLAALRRDVARKFRRGQSEF